MYNLFWNDNEHPYPKKELLLYYQLYWDRHSVSVNYSITSHTLAGSVRSRDYCHPCTRVLH